MAQINATLRDRAASLVAQADRLVQPRERAGKLTEVGDLYRESASVVQASEFYFQAVAVHPENPNLALSRLAGLARDTGNIAVTANLIAGLSHAGHWKDVVTVLTRQADGVDDAEERAGLLLEASRICSERLNDFGRARHYLLAASKHVAPSGRDDLIARLEAHLLTNPADDIAAVEAARLLTEANRAKGAVETLVRSARSAPERGRKAALLFDAAILCADRTQQPVEALVYFYEALTHEPELAHQVQARLDAIQTRWLHLPRVADTLEGIYARMHAPERVFEVMEARLDFATPAERPALLFQLAEHAEYQLLEAERAFVLYRQGLEEGRGELGAFATGMRRVGAEGIPGASEVMLALFARMGRWADLVEVLDGEAQLQVDDAERAALYFRGGEIMQTHLDDLGGAMQRYVQAFQLQPSNPRYLAAGERLYRRRKDWRMVDRLLGLQVQIAGEPDQRQRMLVEQARVRHRKLHDPLGAYHALRRALDEGTIEPAMTALGELIKDDQAFQTIVAGMRAEANDETDEEAARILLELAGLQIEIRQAADAAILTMSEASRLRPDDMECFARVDSLIESHGELRERAQWLVEAGTRPFPVDVQVEWVGQGADLFDDLGMPGAARDARVKALTLAPRDLEMFERALQSAQDAGDAGPLASLLHLALTGEVGPAEPEPVERRQWLHGLGTARAQVGDLEGAAECWQAILSEDPLDAAALRALREWLAAQDHWEMLRGVLDGVVEVHTARGAPAPEELLLELAELAEFRLEDPRLAVVYARGLLDADPESEAHRARLNRLFTALGDREGQIGLLELDLVSAPAEERAVLAERLVTLAAVEPILHGPRRRGLRALADLAPDDMDRWGRLAAAIRMDDAADARPALAEVLARLWALDPRPERIDLLRELARGQVEPVDRARAWQAVLAVLPNDKEAFDALHQAHTLSGDDTAIIDLLMLRRTRTPVDEAHARRTFLREAALVAEVRRGDLDRARRLWREALGPDADDPEALDELIRLAAEASDARETLQYGRTRLDQLDGADRLELARRLARTVQAAPEAATALGLDADAEAQRLWTIVHDADPQAIDALEGLSELAMARSDFDQLLWSLDALVPLVQGPALRRVQAQRAEALAESGDLGAAVEAWEAVRALAPDERLPLTAIRTLSMQRDDHWSAANALKAELRFVRGGDEAVDLNRQLAHLADALSDNKTAVEAWERVLALRPDDDEALGALKTAYADLGRTDDLVRVLRRLLDNAPDDAARVAQLVEAAELLETLRGDPGEAFDCWRRAFLLARADQGGMLAQMRRLAEEGDLWQRYSDVLDLARRSPLKAPEDAAIMVEQAHLAEVHLGAPDKAWMLARAAFERDPTDGPGLALLCRLGEARQAWAEVVAARLKATERGCERARRAELFEEAAEISERELNQPREAFELFARALGSGAKSAEPSLVRLAGEHDLWDRLIEIVKSRWKGRQQTGRRVDALLRLAGLLETTAHDWERAFEQVMLALQLDPRHARARAMAWRLAEANDAWQIVARVFELKSEETEEAWIKAALLRDLATVQAQHLNAPDRAFATLKRAFGVRPWDDDTGAALDALAERTDGWSALAQFYEEEAAWAESAEGRLRLYKQAAEIHRAHGAPAEGARILQRITELHPEDTEAVDAALALRRAAGDPAELAAALEGFLRRAAPGRSTHMLAELADLYAGPLDAPTRAESAWQRMLDLRPDDESVFVELTGSLEARGAWRELAEALAARVDVVDDPTEKTALITRQIDVLWTRLGRRKEAFAFEAQLAEADPADVDRLYAMADRVDAAKGYAALLACAERSLKVVTADHVPRILMLIGRTARDHFGNLTRALETLGRALEIVPEVGLAREVAELLQTRRRYGDLVQIYRQFGPSVLAVGDEPESPELRARWALTVAGLEADQLFQLDDATQTLRLLVYEQPEHVDAWERLRTLALRRKDGQDLADAVVGLAEASAEGLRVSILETGARDVARLGALERAVDLYQRVLAIAPDRPSALDALEALASSRRDVDLRADTLARRAKRAKTAEAKVGVYMELGALHRDGRGDPVAARAAFESALAADPKHIAAMLALVPLVRGARDDEALDALTDWLYDIWRRAKADATRRSVAEPVAELLLRRARQAADAGKGDAVVEWLRQAFEVAPSHADVGQRYADALFQRGELPEAAEIYAQLPEPGGDDPESKAIEHLRRASAFVAADDVPAAMREYEGASHHAVTRMAALTSMASLQQDAGRWEAAIRIQLRLADASADHQTRHQAWVTAGGMALTHLQKTGRAVALFRRALADGLRDPTLLWQVLPVFVDAGRVKEGLEAVARLLVAAKLPSQRATLLGQRARLLRQAGDTDAAIEAWQAAAALAPLNLDAAAAMLDHLDDADDAQRRWILDHVEGAIKDVPAAKSRAVRARLAKIYEAGGDASAAMAAYERLADATPEDQAVRASLAALTQARLNDAPDDDGLRMAAIRHQLALVRHDPEDVKALQMLARLYDVAGVARLRAQPLTVLRWLRAATAAEQGELKALRSAPPRFPDLAPRARMTLLAQDAWRQPAGTLLKALYGWLKADLDALFGGAPEGEPPGATAVEETGAGEDWARVKTALGFEAPRLWVVPGDRPAGLWRVEPLTLVIGAAHLAGSRRRRIFTLTRIAELARGPAILAHYAPEIEAHALYAAAVALSETAEATADFEADVDWTAEWIEFLEAHLDAGQREALARLAANVVASGKSGFEDWTLAVRHAANHLGFVLAGDLGAAVDVLCDETEALANVRPDSADRVRFMLARSPAIADLFDYAFGDRFHALDALLREG